MRTQADYDLVTESEPSPKSLVLVFVICLLAILVSRINGVPIFIPYMIIGGLIIIGGLWLIPKWLSWIWTISELHRRESREIDAITSEVLIWRARERMAVTFFETAQVIRNMNNEQVKAMMVLPSPAEIEFTPSRLDWLVLSQTGKRVNLATVEAMVIKWIELTQETKNPYILPPVNLWVDGIEREQLGWLYDEMALEGLLIVYMSTRTWHAGNSGPRLSDRITPYDALVWLRMESKYQMEA